MPTLPHSLEAAGGDEARACHFLLGACQRYADLASSALGSGCASSAQPPPPLLVEFLAHAWASSGERYVDALLKQTGCAEMMAVYVLHVVTAIGAEIKQWMEQGMVPAFAASTLLAAKVDAEEKKDQGILYDAIMLALPHLLWDSSDRRKGGCSSAVA
jgi:hypothetical protein